MATNNSNKSNQNTERKAPKQSDASANDKAATTQEQVRRPAKGAKKHNNQGSSARR